MLGKIQNQTNKSIAEAIFTTSLSKTRERLAYFTQKLSDETLINIIKRKDDIDLLMDFISSGKLEEHNRINSIEKLESFLQDIHGPAFKDVLATDFMALSKNNRNLHAVPLTEEEHQKLLMELFRNYGLNLGEDLPLDESSPVEVSPSPLSPSGCVWPCAYPQIKESPQKYTWYRSVWFRVNVASLFIPQTKARLFANAHLPLVQYLDSLEDPCDENVDMSRMVYTPIPSASSYNDGIDFVKKREVTWHKIRSTCLEIIREAFPLYMWTVEEVVENLFSQPNFIEFTCYLDEESWAPIDPCKAPVETHKIYYACIYVANQCRELMILSSSPSFGGAAGVSDALWSYYAAFVDFFSYVALCENPTVEASDEYLLTPPGSYMSRKKEMIYTEKLTPWEMYGSHLDVRTKDAGYLPDLFHVINAIPLAGEQSPPPTRLGKIYQKALPFACQGRHIISLVVATIRSDDAFWNLCSHLFWVMLAALYPGDGNRKELTMRDLMRAKHLTQTKETFISMLEPGPAAPCKNGGPLIIAVAFRLHMIYMASFNPTYVDHARECIDWDYFVENTKEAAALIRESDLIPEDPLERARNRILKVVKNSNLRVSRIRRYSCAITLTYRLNEVLQKLIFKDYFFKRIEGGDLSFYEGILSISCKSAISNFLLRIPPSKRFTHETYSVLMLPQYGGISPTTVDLMNSLTSVYYFSKGMPRDFTRVIDQFPVRDFVVVSYFFNRATELERISFVPLDAETVKRTDEAMISYKRYNLFPGQSIPDNAYNVHIALCCKRVCTLMGQGKFGSKMVAFDVEKQCFICSRGKALHKKNKLGADTHQEEDPEGPHGGEEEEEEEEEEEDPEGSPWEEEEEEEEDLDQAQNDHIEPVENLLLRGIDLVSDAIKQNGRGTKRSKEMSDRKDIRTESNQFCRIPCGQPVLTVNLRGRALIMRNTGEKQKQYMFCPGCGAFHIYYILNFSGAVDGLYRCNECAIKETGHHDYIRCAYCYKEISKTSAQANSINITTLRDPKLGGQECMYFCNTHYYVAKRFNHKVVTQEALWDLMKKTDHARMMKFIKK